MANNNIQTTNLNSTFNALKKGRDVGPMRATSVNDGYKRIPKHNLAPSVTASTGGMTKTASGISYGQPQFFSPVHTPINWQIPSKRLEIYQWSRFFYENEPKVASAIDFYAEFPMTDWEHESRDRKVTVYFDKLKRKLRLPYWCKLISHEVHLLGDCFILSEIDCPHCHGAGRIGDQVCEHEGGTVRRIVILNPDYVDVDASPLNPEPTILFRPDESLMNLVQKKGPGYERLHPDVIRNISQGLPLRLDNRNISHLKYGESGYSTYGIGMVKRLFPVLSYKTKLMVAQWIVAERLIVPIKVVKVGTDERPAGAADIASVQAQLQATANDPNVTIVTHHAFDLQWYGASGQVLQLDNQLEFINQEVLDGLMINNALLNGEGPTHASASVGIEAMIQRLSSFRQYISEWILKDIYLPESTRQDFIDVDPDTDEEEYVVPGIKWNKMHLRDEQQYQSNMLQLYDKGIVSSETVLEAFGLDAATELEKKRYDAIQLMALDQQEGAGDGGIGGGFGGGGMGDMGGMGDLGGMGEEGGDMGGMGDMGGGDAPIAAGGGDVVAKSTMTGLDPVNPSQYGGRVLKKKTRSKIDHEKARVYNQASPQDVSQSQGSGESNNRPNMGYTNIERILIDNIAKYQKDGLIRYPVKPQFKIKAGGSNYIIDFAIVSLKVGIEADGEMFHSNPKQLKHDQERDKKLAQQGWTIIRFKDREIEKQAPQVMSNIVKTIMQKENFIKNQAKKA